jgi:hypothetical protein
MNRASGPNVPGVGAGVHVCSVSHYVESGVYCQQADAVVSLEDGYVSYTGPNGNDFPATSLQFVLRKVNADGTEQTVAQTHLTASLATNVMSVDLKSLFSSFGVTVAQGDSYDLEVDSDTGAAQSLIGTTTFTIGPQKPIVCSSRGFSVSIPYGWHVQQGCSSDKYFEAETTDQEAALDIFTYPNTGALALSEAETFARTTLVSDLKASDLKPTDIRVTAVRIGGEQFALATGQGTYSGQPVTLLAAVGSHKETRFLVSGAVQQGQNDAKDAEMQALRASMKTMSFT